MFLGVNAHLLFVQVMDDRWEKEVTEFGAINVTGFRVVDVSRKLVKDFIEVWKREHRIETISVSGAYLSIYLSL